MMEKRFKVIETITHDDKRIYELTKNDIGYYNFKGEKLLAHMICNELNRLLEENEQLKKALKNQYINEVCETCKFGKYDVNWMGEGEFECLKGHDAVECDGKTECDDFELDLERFLK